MTQTGGEIYHVLGLNQYCENDYTTQSNLQIQCNPYQTTFSILHRTRKKKNSPFVWKHKRPHIARSILKKEKWNQPSQLQNILQSYSHQENMLLAQKQKYRTMEQGRKPRDKPTQL